MGNAAACDASACALLRRAVGKGNPMAKTARAFDVFLRALLTVALAVSFTPIPRDASYAAQSEDGAGSENAIALTSGSPGEVGSAVAVADASGSQGEDGESGERVSADGEGAAAEDKASGETTGEDAAASGDADVVGETTDAARTPATPTSPSALVGAEAAGAAMPSTLGTSDAAAQTQPSELAEPVQSGAYPYGKLMASGYVYPCDFDGTLVRPIDEDNPGANSIDARLVEHLIVDYYVAGIPAQLCEGSTTLKSVRFVNDRLDSIGENAFFQCANLSSISFSGMTIGTIGQAAFYGCDSLTSLNIAKTATIGALGERCFMYSGLVSTGLDNIEGLSAIPDQAYRGCENLTDTGLKTNVHNQRLETVGAQAFAGCVNLSTSGLEENTTVRQLGDNCFTKTSMAGGLLLPRDSRIEQLPKGAFQGSNLRFAYFRCDHAVLIASDAFPKYNMPVLVSDRAFSLYSAANVARNWESCNGIGPFNVAESLQLEVETNADVMEYEVGQPISYAGMRIAFGCEGKTYLYDCADVQSQYVFSEFFQFTPSEGKAFESDDHGAFVHIRYDDGEQQLETHSLAPLREKGNDNVVVNVHVEGALPGEYVEGAGQYKQNSTCVVNAVTAIPGRTAYWKDVNGNVRSDYPQFSFRASQNEELTAVFTNEVTVAPQARLNSALGEPVEGVNFTLKAAGTSTEYPNEYTTHPGREVIVTCRYDSSLMRITGWDAEPGSIISSSADKSNITYVVPEAPELAFVFERNEPLNIVAKSAGGFASGGVSAGGRHYLGDVVDISAAPDVGSYFLGWTHRGELLSTDTTFTYTVRDFDDVTGWFVLDPSRTWVAVRASSAQPDLGSVEGAGMYAEGTQVSLVAKPAAGCKFTGWLCDGQPIEGDATLTIEAHGQVPASGGVMVSPKYTATFAPEVCNVEYSQVIDMGGRTLMDGVDVPNASGTQQAQAGSSVELDAAALGMLDDDIAFAGWYNVQTGEQLSADAAFSFTPTGSAQLEARFTLKDVAVHINPAQTTDSSEAYAHLAVDAANCYRNAGEAVPLAAVPDNAQFLGWYATDGSSDGEYVISNQLTCEYAVENPAGAGVAAQAEITPRYCAQQASVVLGVADTDKDGNPAGQFLFSGLYGVGSQVTVVAVPEPGYVFDYITDAAGRVVATAECAGSYTFLLTENTQLVAHFRWTDDEDEAFEALKTALIAAVLTVAGIATAYGFGELVDPIAAETVVEIEAAQNSEELAAAGKKFFGKIKDLFDGDDPGGKPDKPKGDHKVEVVAVANPEVGGVVRGGGVHYEGTEAVLTAVPNLGYHFVCWKLDGVEYTVSPTATVPITKATPEVTTMTAVFEKDVTVTTSVEVTGVAADLVTGCNATPDVQRVERGREAQVVATEAPDYAFVGWFENGIEVSKAAVYVFPAEADRHLVAKFRKADKTITVGVDPAESADVLCDGVPVEGGVVRAADGDILTFTACAHARPDDAEKTYKLVEWRETDAQGRTIVNRQDVCEYRVDGNARIVAVMDGKDSHTVRAKADPAEGGTVALKQGERTGEVLEVPEGQTVTAEAKAAEGYLFDGWYVTYGADDVTPTYVSSEQVHTFTPAADCTVTARFTRMCKVKVVVEPADSLEGKYTVVGDGYSVGGEPVTLSVSLDKSVRDEFTFKGWFCEGSEVPLGTDPTHLEVTPEQDMTVRAVYIPHRYAIKVETKDYQIKRGSVEIEGYPAGTTAALVGYGSTVTLRATPEEGFRLKKWKGSNKDKRTEEEIKVTVTENVTYTAVFTGMSPEVTIAADTWLGGTVTCNGWEVEPTTDTYKLGEKLHLVAAPRDGWLFWGWYVNGKFYSLDKDVTIVAESKSKKVPRCSIVAAFKPLDVMCVPIASPAEGGSVRASRIFSERNTDVALKAQAAPGYVFTGWYTATGMLESEEPEFVCHEMMSHIHEARFEPCSYTVTATPVVANEAGELVEDRAAGWIEGAGEVGAGYAAALEAHALPGYAFERWVDVAGNTVGEDANLRFVPSEDADVRAVFAKKQYTVNVFAVEGYGIATGGGTYAAGEVACVSAVANAGATFVGWFVDGACVSTEATYRFTVREDTDMQALFAVGTYTVRTIASPAEAGWVSGFGGFAEGQRTTLSATAKPGFTFDCWRDAQGNVVSNLPDCTVAVAGDAAYTACFTRNVYGVELTSSIEGVGELTGGGSYEFGQVVELNAQQTDDRRFAGWQLVDEDGTATAFASDAHCWFTLDDKLVSSLDGNVLELQALFADPYEVAVSADVVVQGKNGDRRCRVQGTGVYQAGSQVTLNAVAGLGYKFVGWSTDAAGENVVDTNAVLAFTADSDAMYYAQFAVDGQVTVTVTQSSIFRGFTLPGTISYDKGSLFMAMAVPWPGYRFSHWINDAGVPVSYNSVYVGVAQQDMQLTAVFYDSGLDVQAATYPKEAGLSLVIPGTGVGYINPSWLLTLGKPGWKFRYWIDENGCPVAFSPLTARPTLCNKTYTAYYVRGAWTVTAIDPREGGHIEGSAGVDAFGFAVVGTVEDGESFTLHAVPDAGYAFAGWYAMGEGADEDAEPLNASADWTFVPEDDVTVVARFAELPTYEVTAEAERGTVVPQSQTVVAGGQAAFAAQPDEGCYLERVSVAETAADGTAGVPVDLDISAYKGGGWAMRLADVNAPEALTFAFVQAGAPQVYAQPQGKALYEGGNLSLSVSADAAQAVLDHEAAATGAAATHTLSYQWFYTADEQGEGVALEGEVQPTLTREHAAAGDAGWYYCRITQTYLGTETVTDSNRARVTVVTPGEFVFNASDLPVATVHGEYEAVVEPATGGARPYTYSLAEGSALPDGLRLEETVADGRATVRVVGTPDAVGVFGFDIACADAQGRQQMAHFTLVVKPQVVDLAFAQRDFVYNGSPQRPALLGVPPELADAVTFAYTGTGETRYSGSAAPVDAGTYRVMATLNAGGCVGRAACTFEIAKRPVAFSVDAPDVVYDGQPHGAAVDAQGLDAADYTVTYRGVGSTDYGPTADAPRDAGNYAVVATAVNPNITGSETDFFTISKAPQAITGTTVYSGVYGSAGIAFDNIAQTPVTFELVNGEDGAESPISLQGRYATINAAGTARVMARAAASRNYLAADDVELTVTVAPAQLLVVVSDAARAEGQDNPAFTSSLVSRADTSDVKVTYACEANKESPAGQYAINASVADANFAATVMPGTLTVTAKPAPDPGPDPVDPDNPQPEPDPDNPEPGPGPAPDPDNPGPGPVDPDPDNPDPGPAPNPDNPQPGPIPDPDNPQPGPTPDPGKPDPGPDNPDPSDPDGPSDPTDPSDPDNPSDPSDPSDPADPDSPDTPNNPTGPTPDGKADSGTDAPSNPAQRSAVASSSVALGQTGDAAAQGATAALLAAALAAALGAAASRKRRR